MNDSHHKKRGRGRQSNHQRRGRSNGNQHHNGIYESNGPQVKIKGNPRQIYDKYISMARDLRGPDDEVLQENYLQHADHYFRLSLSEMTRERNHASLDASNISEETSNNDKIESADTITDESSEIALPSYYTAQTQGNAGDESSLETEEKPKPKRAQRQARRYALPKAKQEMSSMDEKSDAQTLGQEVDDAKLKPRKTTGRTKRQSDDNIEEANVTL